MWRALVICFSLSLTPTLASAEINCRGTRAGDSVEAWVRVTRFAGDRSGRTVVLEISEMHKGSSSGQSPVPHFVFLDAGTLGSPCATALVSEDGASLDLLDYPLGRLSFQGAVTQLECDGTL